MMLFSTFAQADTGLLATKIDSVKNLVLQSNGTKKADLLITLGILMRYDSTAYFKYLNEADKIYQDSYNQKGETEVLFQKGHYYSDNKYFTISKKYFHKALDKAKNHHLISFEGKIYFWLGITFRRASIFDSALYYFRNANVIYSKRRDLTGIGNSLMHIGSTYFSMGKYQTAIDYTDSSYYFFKQQDTLWLMGQTVYAKALCYYQLGRYDSAIVNLFKALKVFNKINDVSDIWNSYDMLGNSFYKLKKYKEALLYYRKGLQIKNKYCVIERMVPFMLPLAYSYNNIARVLNETGDYDSALYYAKKSLKIKLKEGSKNDIANSYDYLGRIYLNLNKPDSAILFTQRALNLFIKTKDKSGQVNTLINLGKAYKIKGDNKKSVNNLAQALKIAQGTQLMDKVITSAGLLSDLYESTGNFKQALKFFKIQTAFNDSIFNKQSTQIIDELQTKYKTLQKEKQIHLEQEKYRRKKLQLNYAFGAGAAILILAVLIIILLIHNRKQREELLLQEADNLRKELELKNRDLICNVSKIYTKNQVINKVAHTLIKSSGNFKQANTGLIKDIISNLKQNLDETSWTEFEIRFANVHQNFYKTLDEKYPGLTKSERKLCAMLKLGMSSKEIASITMVRPESVDTARSRLRKKLNVENNINLADFISKL